MDQESSEPTEKTDSYFTGHIAGMKRFVHAQKAIKVKPYVINEVMEKTGTKKAEVRKVSCSYANQEQAGFRLIEKPTPVPQDSPPKKAKTKLGKR